AKAVFGAAFPGNGATVAVGVTAAGQVFRSDGTKVAQYDDARHAWKPAAVGKVREFFAVGPELWAWAPDEQTLYRWQDPDWVAEDAATHRWQSIDGVKGAAEFVALKGEGGGLFARTAAGSVHRYGPAWAPVAGLAGVKVESLVAAGNHVIARAEAGLYALDGA